MKFTYRPGTPEEVVANLHRLRGRAGSGARMLNRAGRPLAGRDVEAEAEALKDAGATIGHIYKHGFPAATPHEQAMDEALAAARAHGRPLSAEIVQTPEHEAAGEFLVKVLLLGGEVPRT
ncbi:hypothetical protein [Nonomuraea sp. NPDC023979]|uniref:hypothetical protein n=1 Tax=Nonomuraea sp. NPDC023979 TaxID=3154796 RepID=UPI0033F310D7